VSEQTRELRARNQELNVLLQELTQRLAASEEQHREQCAHNQELMQRLAASEQQYRELLTRTHALELAEAREQGRREFVVPALAELETKRQREDAELEEKHEGDGTLRAAATKAFIGAPAAPVEEPAETEQAKAARKAAEKAARRADRRADRKADRKAAKQRAEEEEREEAERGAAERMEAKRVERSGPNGGHSSQVLGRRPRAPRRRA
jgi:hypothetical protein